MYSPTQQPTLDRPSAPPMTREPERPDLVAAVRRQIEAGSYLDDRKLDIAIARLLPDLY